MTLLTDTKIKNLQPKDKLYRIFDGQGYGLYLEVLPNGSKKWRQTGPKGRFSEKDLHWYEDIAKEFESHRRRPGQTPAA